MTVSFQSENASDSSNSSDASDASDLTVRQQSTVDVLRLFSGAEAEALYEASGRVRLP